MLDRIIIIVVVFIFLLAGCSGSERFTGKENNEKNEKSEKVEKPGKIVTGNILNSVRVLLQNSMGELKYQVNTPVNLFDSKNKIAIINPGNTLFFYVENEFLSIKINEQKFHSDYFELHPTDPINLLSLNTKNYRGKLRFIISQDEVKVINIVNIEDYLKGVLPSEMPIGRDEKNLEALKAFSICARTYSLMKTNMNQYDFDLYVDVRDQVYGGADNEEPLSNRAVDETRGIVLFYEEEPAVTFYHSTCGGETENSYNVFTKKETPYLSGIVDGVPSYCSISPRFEWRETYDRKLFLERIVVAGILPDNDSELERIEVKSRFKSGRVNELEITIVDDEEIQKKYSIYGNNIRTIIRTADSKSILFSTNFEISLDGNKVIIAGKGYGHGVGMCQYGAIGQAHAGIKYLEILNHYFPGTHIKKYYE